MALKVLKNHHALPTYDGPVKASMAMRAFQISAAAMRRSVDDQWAFLEFVDAPQWVDLSLEETLQGVEGDDPWFYQSHPYHEAPLEELGSLSDWQVHRSSYRKTIAEAQIEEAKILEVSERLPAAIVKMIPKKLGSAEIQGELNQMAKNQAWPRSKAKRVQLQPNKQILDEDENRPGILEDSTLDTCIAANYGGKVLSAKSGNSADLISVLMNRVRISDGLSTPSKLKDFDKVRSSSPKIKTKDSINKTDHLEHSRLQTNSSACSRSVYNDTGKVRSNFVKMEFRPQRQEKHTFKLKRSSEEDDTSVRSSEDAAERLTLSNRIVNEDIESGGKHDKLEGTKQQACCNSPCISEAIVSTAEASSGNVVFKGKEGNLKQQPHPSEGITDKMADVSIPQPSKQKILAFTRIKKPQRAVLRMSLPTMEYGNGTQATKLDPVNSREVKPRISSKGHLQAKVAGTSKEPIRTSTTGIKTGILPKVVNYNQKQISIRSSMSTVPAVSSKKDNRSFQKSGKSPAMHEIKSRTYGADGDDLAALIAEHNRKVRVVPKYEPRRHSMKDIKEWEIRTGQHYYSLQPLKREVVNQEIAAFKRSECSNIIMHSNAIFYQ